MPRSRRTAKSLLVPTVGRHAVQVVQGARRDEHVEDGAAVLEAAIDDLREALQEVLSATYGAAATGPGLLGLRGRMTVIAAFSAD